MNVPIETCDTCETVLVPDANFCHRCGHRIAGPPAPVDAVAEQLITVKLHGLYDESRREELALALIPILANLSGRIDMGHVEHLDVGALTSLVPLLEIRESEAKAADRRYRHER